MAPQTAFVCDLHLAPLASSQLLYLRIQLPVALFHVSHGDGGVLDEAARAIVFRVDPERDASRPFTVSLIAERSAAGRARPLTAELLTADSGAVVVVPSANTKSTVATASVSVDPVDADGWFHPDIPPAVVAVSALLAAVVMLTAVWMLRRGRRARARAPRQPGIMPVPRDRVMRWAVLCVISAAFAIVTLPAPAESLRSRLTFIATTCTILDRAASGVPFPGSADAITNDIAEPMAALRYRVGTVDRISTGFNVRGTVRTAWSEGTYRSVAVGALYPCWYDPDRPERVVLHRGPSAAAMLTLIPIAVFLWSVRSLRRAWRA